MSVLTPLVDRLDDRLRDRAWAGSLWPANGWQVLGHVALVCLVLLVVTGIVLAIPYEPGIDPVTYHGRAGLYDGVELPRAFASVVRISEDLPGGLFLRRLHAASAHLLVATVVAHLLRVLWTGAFQGRRALNHLVGMGLLALVLVAGWTGDNLTFGLLAGTSLRIGYSILGSIPYVGEPLALLVYGGEFPTGAILERSFWAHALLLPGALVTGAAVHLWLYRRNTPTEHPRSGDDARVRGVPFWPDMVRLLVVLGVALAGVLVLAAVLVPWSDVRLEGPYQLAHAGNTLQPPWYLFFPEGAMRILPAIDLPLPGGARIGNVFVAAVVLPGVLLGVLAVFPWLDPRLGGSDDDVHVMQHPLAVPGRAALLAGVFGVLAVLTVGATVDVLAEILGRPVRHVIWALRVLLVAVPGAASAAAWALARRRRRHP